MRLQSGGGAFTVVRAAEHAEKFAKVFDGSSVEAGVHWSRSATGTPSP
jgi:hypothetical protein